MGPTGSSFQLVWIALFSGGLLEGSADSQTELRLDEGCRGLLQKISTTGTDDVFDVGSGSGGDPHLIMWMSVCSKEFGQKEAEVVCRELDCASNHQGTPERVHMSRFNVTISDIPGFPMFLTTFPFSCSGSEESVEKCQRTGTTCNFDHESDIVAVECRQPVATATKEESTSSTTGQRSSAPGTNGAFHSLLSLCFLLVFLFSCSHV